MLCGNSARNLILLRISLRVTAAYEGKSVKKAVKVNLTIDEDMSNTCDAAAVIDVRGGAVPPSNNNKAASPQIRALNRQPPIFKLRQSRTN